MDPAVICFLVPVVPVDCWLLGCCYDGYGGCGGCDNSHDAVDIVVSVAFLADLVVWAVVPVAFAFLLPCVDVASVVVLGAFLASLASSTAFRGPFLEGDAVDVDDDDSPCWPHLVAAVVDGPSVVAEELPVSELLAQSQ